MLAVAERGVELGVEGTAGRKGVALDARNLDEAADGVAGHAEVVLQAHLRRILYLRRRAAKELAGGCRGHGAGHTDLALASHLRAGDRGVVLDDVAEDAGRGQGMKFRNDDSLLAMDVVPGDSDKDLFVVTNEGFAKRTAISEYRLQGRNGLGIKAVQLVEGRGALVGALVVSEDDQVMAIMKSGKVIRSNVDEVKRTGRNTQGVTFAKPDKGDTILSIARNEEKDEPEDGGDAAANGTAETAQSGENVNNADEA